MSLISVLDTAGTVGIPSNSVGGGDLTPEAKNALVAQAKDIIAGRVRPPAMAA